MPERFDVELQELDRTKKKAIEELPDTGLTLADLDKDLPAAESKEKPVSEQATQNP